MKLEKLAAKFRKFDQKYHFVLILSFLIMIIYLSMALSMPEFSQKPIQLNKFSVDVPLDAEYKETEEGIEITGPYEQYLSEIIITNTSLNIFNEALERGSANVKSYNDTHYIIMTEPGGLESEPDRKFFEYYDFILPKKDFNSSNNKILNEKTNMIIAKGNYREIMDFLEESIRT